MPNSTIKPEFISAPTGNSEKVALRVKGLRKSFGKKVAVADLDFSIPFGSVAGFLGPNGAGKTTALRLLLGLVPADAGEMELLGNPMPSGRVAALERTGTLVESPSFIESFSGLENLWWFGSLHHPLSASRVDEMLDLVGLREAAARPFGNYSTGMKQRLGVACALLHTPDLLILDEPTNGMDPQGRAQMRDIFKKIHDIHKTTIFLSSHLIDEIQRLCDFVVIIDAGRTVRQGFVSEILSRERESWEIRLAPGGDLQKAREIAAKLPEVLTFENAPRGLIVSLAIGASPRLNRALLEAGIDVAALIPLEASLEETFLKLTDSKVL
ncbi:MAG: ABC transporter ATP-binding protein [Candidatus Riflebacteria bacterium]|nr:ABC transporter ATP-binding protein [Candidatus Riflebacteria bacterium]